MDLKAFLCLIVTISPVPLTSGTNTCEIRDREDCRYTVICDHYAGNAWTPECDSEPFVTFIVTGSYIDVLTAGFFGSTNFDSRVRVFKGIDNRWKEIESYSFRYYSKTIRMDLSKNGIETIKMEALRNLIFLQHLNISGNAIKSLSSRSLFITENRNPDLEVLDLSNNLLTDLSGDVFENLLNLKELYLQNNKLETLTEDCLGSLKNLSVLYLQNNQITSINMTLINLKYLKKLDISNNRLTQIQGYELNRLVALETVNMSHNAIEFIESNSFNQAFNLLMVDLSHNKIKSSIESLMFVNNNKLIYLDLYQNNITQIQDNAFKHNMLNYLNLAKNNLTGEITENTFAGLINITSLNLSNQSITIIRNNAFSDAVKLAYLNLSQNSIKLIENSSFAGALSLSILDVSYNKLSNVNFLRNSLANITELYLQNNSLVKIQKNATSYQTLMKKLDISSNKIQNIEENSLPFKSLQYLNISGNRLFGVLSNNVFGPAKFLRYLDLSNFKFNKIDKMALVNLPVANRVNISHNELEYIDPDNFMGMDNMISLDLSYNKLPCFHLNNGSLIKLKALYLNNNNLSNISRTLINMTGLVFVDLSNNIISELSDVPFSNLYNLKVLHLSNNKIKVFNNPETNFLTNLATLSLSANELTEINLSYYKDLLDADISNNKILFFNSSFFENLDSLQSLHIGYNNISKIIPGTFQNVRMLKLLNMSHNHLSNLRYGSFRGLNETEVLDLSYNDIADIDVDVFHECVELKKLIIDYNSIKSLDVERLVLTLTKLTSLSIGGNPLSCQQIVWNIRSFNKNNMLRQIDVTSIDKIFHEDNVHGIKCGDKNMTSSTEKPKEEEPAGDTTSMALIIWCSVLTMIVLVVLIAMYMYRRNRSVIFRESRLQLRNSLSEISGLDTQRDLLG